MAREICFLFPPGTSPLDEAIERKRNLAEATVHEVTSILGREMESSPSAAGDLFGLTALKLLYSHRVRELSRTRISVTRGKLLKRPPRFSRIDAKMGDMSCRCSLIG